MARDQTNYDLFISYARKDNQPDRETGQEGWVTAPLCIFFDTDDWLA